MNKIYTFLVMSLLTLMLYACGVGSDGGSANTSSGSTGTIASLKKNSTTAGSSAAILSSGGE